MCTVSRKLILYKIDFPRTVVGRPIPYMKFSP